MEEALARGYTYREYRGFNSPVALDAPQDLFEYQRAKLIEDKLVKPDGFDKHRKYFPRYGGLFLLMPAQPAPVNELNWDELASRFSPRGIRGRCYLKSSGFRDVTGPYQENVIIASVLDGRHRPIGGRESPASASEQILKRGRHPYSLWMGYIHLRLFDYFVKENSPVMVGTQYGDNSYPFMYTMNGGLSIACVRNGFEVVTNMGLPSHARFVL